MGQDSCRADDTQTALDEGVAELASLIAWLHEREPALRAPAEPLADVVAGDGRVWLRARPAPAHRGKSEPTEQALSGGVAAGGPPA